LAGDVQVDPSVETASDCVASSTSTNRPPTQTTRVVDRPLGRCARGSTSNRDQRSVGPRPIVGSPASEVVIGATDGDCDESGGEDAVAAIEGDVAVGTTGTVVPAGDLARSEALDCVLWPPESVVQPTSTAAATNSATPLMTITPALVPVAPS
jgi:hypothetical protein